MKLTKKERALIEAGERVLDALTDDHERCDLCCGEDEDGNELGEGKHNPERPCGQLVKAVREAKR